MAYLGEKDAAFQEINTAQNFNQPQIINSQRNFLSVTSTAPYPIPTSPELTASQGETAMDLDTLFREKGSDSR